MSYPGVTSECFNVPLNSNLPRAPPPSFPCSLLTVSSRNAAPAAFSLSQFLTSLLLAHSMVTSCSTIRFFLPFGFKASEHAIRKSAQMIDPLDICCDRTCSRPTLDLDKSSCWLARCGRALLHGQPPRLCLLYLSYQRADGCRHYAPYVSWTPWRVSKIHF